MATPKDPYGNFNFKLEIDGIVRGAFHEVGGLDSSIDVIEHREGGENITTRGIPLLELPAGTRLKLGPSAVVEITGLRNPCVQIDRFQSGLLAAVVGRGESGAVWRKTGSYPMDRSRSYRRHEYGGRNEASEKTSLSS